MEYCQQWARGKCRRSQCKFIHDALQLPVMANRDANLIDPSGGHHTGTTTDASATPLLINAEAAVVDVDGQPQKDSTSYCVYIRSNGWRCKCTGIFVADSSGELYCHNHYQLIHNQTKTVLADDDGDNYDDDTNTSDRKLDINTHTNNKRTAHSLTVSSSSSSVSVPIRQVKRVSAKSRMVNPFEVHFTVGGMKRDRIVEVDRAAFSHPERDLVLDIGESPHPHSTIIMLLLLVNTFDVMIVD